MTKAQKERVDEIRRLNSKKAHGHIDSAVQHVSELLRIIDFLEGNTGDGGATAGAGTR